MVVLHRAGLALVLAIALAPPRPARACSCPARTPAQILASDEVAVIGAVVSREEVVGYNHGYRVRVDRALKGDSKVGDEQTVVLPRGEASCGGDLEPGRTYAIFGSRGHCGELRVDGCQGSWRVDRAIAKELGVADFSPKPATVRDFPKETLERCNPILGPRNVLATADILSLGEPDPQYHAEMPVRLRIVDTTDPGDANGKLVAGQEIDVHAFFLKLDPKVQTPATCFGPHNKPGQRVKVDLVVTPDRINATNCNVAPIDAGAPKPDASALPAPAAPASRGCGCTAAPERGGTMAALVTALVALVVARRARRRGGYSIASSGAGCGDLSTTASQCIQQVGCSASFISNPAGSERALNGTTTLGSDGSFTNGSITEGTASRTGCTGTWDASAQTLTVDCGGMGSSQSCVVTLTRTGATCN